MFPQKIDDFYLGDGAIELHNVVAFFSNKNHDISSLAELKAVKGRMCQFISNYSMRSDG